MMADKEAVDLEAKQGVHAATEAIAAVITADETEVFEGGDWVVLTAGREVGCPGCNIDRNRKN